MQKSSLSNIRYTLATPADATIMASYRIEFLTDLLGPQPFAQMELLRSSLTDYFINAIEDGSYVGIFAKSGDHIAGTGGMVIRSQPGSLKNPSGHVAYIMNMYTVPAYRKMGICSTILNMLIEEANERGIYAYELHATQEGEPLYIKNNFLKHHEPTYRRYDFIGQKKE